MNYNENLPKSLPVYLLVFVVFVLLYILPPFGRVVLFVIMMLILLFYSSIESVVKNNTRKSKILGLGDSEKTKNWWRFPNGDKYEGEWKNGLMHGKGTLIKNDGTKKEGIWKNGKFIEE